MSVSIRSLARTCSLKNLTVAAIFTFALLLYAQHKQVLPQPSLERYKHEWLIEEQDSQYETIPFGGYSNYRVPGNASCAEIAVYDQQIQISKGLHLQYDLPDIVFGLASSMIDYSTQPKDTPYREKVTRTWGTMAGTSVWIPKLQVFFTVTRLYHYHAVRSWPKISFLYAQVYDSDWVEQKDYIVKWHGNNITFPRVLDVDSPYKVGGAVFGPEDPRLLLEEGQDEPVIIFNQIEDVRTETRTRMMFMHMPFSNATTKFYIQGDTPKGNEKNWAPFFVNLGKTPEQLKWPSQHIWFIYSHHTLEVLKCHVSNGVCHWAYRQQDAGNAWNVYRKEREYGDTGGVMRGGTNFYPISFSYAKGFASYVGFPRSHTDAGCPGEPLYRPYLTILTTDGESFWLEYSSEALDFGLAIYDDVQYNDVCGKGRILLANSVSRFDEAKDKMTVMFSVADTSVQVAEIKGIKALVKNLPQFDKPILEAQLEETVQWHRNVSHDVTICGIISASDYARKWWNVTDRLERAGFKNVIHGPMPEALPSQ